MENRVTFAYTGPRMEWTLSEFYSNTVRTDNYIGLISEEMIKWVEFLEKLKSRNDQRFKLLARYINDVDQSTVYLFTDCIDQTYHVWINERMFKFIEDVAIVFNILHSRNLDLPFAWWRSSNSKDATTSTSSVEDNTNLNGEEMLTVNPESNMIQQSFGNSDEEMIAVNPIMPLHSIESSDDDLSILSRQEVDYILHNMC